MATFPSFQPLYGVSVSRKFRILKNNFGDGYTQRAADGLNYDMGNFNFSAIVSTTDAQTIVDFLDARAGYESFDFTLPRESTAKKWTCEEYSRVPIGPNLDRIEALFLRQYDLS